MIIINNDNAYISILPISPRGTRRAHMSPEEYGNFSRLKLLEINMFLYYKNKATGDIFEENGIREQFSVWNLLCPRQIKLTLTKYGYCICCFTSKRCPSATKYPFL